MSATSKSSTTIAVSVSPGLGFTALRILYIRPAEALLVESWSPSDAVYFDGKKYNNYL